MLVVLFYIYTFNIGEESYSYDDDNDLQYSDYENLPDHISTSKQLNDLAEDIGRRTGKWKYYIM